METSTAGLYKTCLSIRLLVFIASLKWKVQNLNKSSCARLEFYLEADTAAFPSVNNLYVSCATRVEQRREEGGSII